MSTSEPEPGSGARAVSASGQDIAAADFLRVWWQVAILSFGGPAAQIAVMQRLVVDDRGWLSQHQFNHALSFCLLLPGPEAQQLATYIGWSLKGVRGAFLAGVLFVLPGALIMLGLSLVYVSLGQTGLIDGLLFGLKCAVLAIVAQALARMAGKLVAGPWALAITVAAFVAMFVLDLPFPLVLLTAALVGWWVFAASPLDIASTVPERPVAWVAALAVLAGWLLPLLLLLLVFGADSIWTQLAGFFSLVSVLSFGGAYAVLAWVAQYAAEQQAWVSAGEMLDGLGLAETTPGPLILVTQFVGFLASWRESGSLPPILAGMLGAGLTTWMMFAPSFFWVFLLAPLVERLRRHAGIAGALRGIAAAVVGVIANLAAWFALRLLFAELKTVEVGWFSLQLPLPGSLDPLALVLSLGALGLLFLTRLGLVSVVLLSGLAGWLSSL